MDKYKHHLHRTTHSVQTLQSYQSVNMQYNISGLVVLVLCTVFVAAALVKSHPAEGSPNVAEPDAVRKARQAYEDIEIDIYNDGYGGSYGGGGAGYGGQQILGGLPGNGGGVVIDETIIGGQPGNGQNTGGFFSRLFGRHEYDHVVILLNC